MAIVHNSIMSTSERAQWVIINITAYDEDIRKTKTRLNTHMQPRARTSIIICKWQQALNSKREEGKCDALSVQCFMTS